MYYFTVTPCSSKEKWCGSILVPDEFPNVAAAFSVRKDYVEVNGAIVRLIKELRSLSYRD